MTLNTAPIPNVVNQPADDMSQKNTEFLRESAEQELRSLLMQKKVIHDYSSHLSQFIEQQYKQKSRLTDLSAWYARQAWYEKISTGLLFAGAAALIGAIANMAVLCAILATAIYCALATLLIEHDDINRQREQSLTTTIVSMSQLFSDSGQTLQTIEQSLHDILIELAKRNVQSAEFILQLEHTHRTLQAEHTEIKNQLTTAIQETQSAQNRLTQESVLLAQTRAQLDDTNKKMAKNNTELSTICNNFKALYSSASVAHYGQNAHLAKDDPFLQEIEEEMIADNQLLNSILNFRR